MNTQNQNQTVQHCIDMLSREFGVLPKVERARLLADARRFILLQPGCADHSNFWRGLSARQVESAACELSGRSKKDESEAAQLALLAARRNWIQAHLAKIDDGSATWCEKDDLRRYLGSYVSGYISGDHIREIAEDVIATIDKQIYR